MPVIVLISMEIGDQFVAERKDTTSKACPFFEFFYDLVFQFGTYVGEVC